ncbi:MAG: DUF3329 domain-containing protein [Paracoccaceae bacterium]
MRRFLDPNDPFFRPLWIRVVVLVILLGWSAYEFATATPFWGVLFLAVGVWFYWVFFVARTGK